MNPGAIQLTVMFLAATSFAKALVKPPRPALLDTVELVMALEEEFELEIADEEAEKISTVQEAVNYINSNS